MGGIITLTMSETVKKVVERVKRIALRLEQNLFEVYSRKSQIQFSGTTKVIVVLSHLQLFSLFFNDKVI